MSVFTQPADTSSAPVPRISASDLWLFLLRFFTAYPMIHYQAWSHAKRAAGYIWDDKSWSVVDQMTKLSIPMAETSAVVLVFILLTSSFGILIGFLTRINSILLFICLGFVLISQVELNEGSLTPQTLLIYLGLALTLSISGPGLFSLDALMTRRRRKKKRAPSRFA